ncbi:MAG: hypothetical protein V3V57_07280 [Spirochaetia bacterium]
MGRYYNDVMPSADTSFRVEKALFGIYRKMGPQGRCAIGIELSDNMRNIAFAAYKTANPTLSHAELEMQFFEKVLGWKLPLQPKARQKKRKY